MKLDFPLFRPHPLVRGGHVQTLLGCYLNRRIPANAVQHRVTLPDGDQIVLHEEGADDVGSASGAPAALLIHGLGGCHQSSYMDRCSAKLRAVGVRVFRMDLRGCGAGLALARQPLHAGRSDDVAAAVAAIHEKCPDSPLHLVGFSMGANLVLKLAGELADAAPRYLASVMAVAPPIDLVACCREIQRGWNRLYDRAFVRGLLRHLRRRARLVPDAAMRPFEFSPRKLIDFDNQFTAPLSGFKSALDYYEAASSGPLLPRIAIPTLVVSAASDPIVPVQCFEAASYSATTQVVIAPCGGHLGFIAARESDPDCRWLDWRVVEWIRMQASGSLPPKAENAGELSAKPGKASTIRPSSRAWGRDRRVVRGH